LITTAILLALAVAGFALLRVYSGMKNGAFYAKCMYPDTPLQPYVENLHRIEAPQWYVMFGSLFVLVLAVGLLIGHHGLLVTLLAAALVAQGASALASYKYQAYINLGSNLPAVDPNENPKAEFAFRLGGKNYSFWWSRPWYGRRRRYAPVLGFLLAAAGIALICFV
jgi:hypothetical protein